MRVIGVDPSLTRTGVAVWSGGSWDIRSIKTNRKDSDITRQSFIANELRGIFTKDSLILMEDFGISARYSQGGKFVERIELCGMIKYVADSVLNVPIFSVHPSQLMSFAAAMASARKEEVVDAILTHWKLPVQNNDEADACSLALLGVRCVSDLNLDSKREKAYLNFIGGHPELKNYIECNRLQG